MLEMTDETMVTAKPMPRRPVIRCTNARVTFTLATSTLQSIRKIKFVH